MDLKLHLLLIALNDSGLAARLSVSTRAVLMSLTRFLDYVPDAPLPTWTAYPKLSTLELSSGLGRRTVEYALAELRSAGLLSVTRSGRERMLYTLSLPQPIFQSLPSKIRFSLRRPVHNGAYQKCTTVHRSPGYAIYTKSQLSEDSSREAAAPAVNDDDLRCALKRLKDAGNEDPRHCYTVGGAKRLLQQYPGRYDYIATRAIAAMRARADKQTIPNKGGYLATLLRDRDLVNAWINEADSKEAAKRAAENAKAEATAKLREAQATEAMRWQEQRQQFQALTPVQRRQRISQKLLEWPVHGRKRDLWMNLCDLSELPAVMTPNLGTFCALLSL